MTRLRYALRSLAEMPVERPDELALLASTGAKAGRVSTSLSGDREFVFNYWTLRELERQGASMAAIAGFREIGANLAYGTQTLNQSLEADAGAGNPVAVLGYGYWHDRLGGDPGVLNKPIRATGQVLTMVGVTPRNFTGQPWGASRRFSCQWRSSRC